MSIKLILYSTSHCHLCEQAIAMLDDLMASSMQQISFSYEIVDIIDSDEHMALYSIHIPVIYRLDNKETLYWPFTKSNIAKLVSTNNR